MPPKKPHPERAHQSSFGFVFGSNYLAIHRFFAISASWSGELRQLHGAGGGRPFTPKTSEELSGKCLVLALAPLLPARRDPLAPCIIYLPFSDAIATLDYRRRGECYG